MTASRDLSALLGSRICHDLISPLGAIGNGVELLTMTGTALSPEMSLIAESVENANARIRFFRVAFGAAQPGQSVSSGEIRSILADLERAGRMSYQWDPAGDLPRASVKLVFLLLQCMETSMPRGGTVQITLIGKRWEVRGQATQFRVDETLWSLLVDPADDIPVEPANVHFALIGEAARAAGLNLETTLGEREILTRF